MTDKERLENMSPVVVAMDGNVLIKGEDWHWLTEQAGRVQELLKENDFFEKAHHTNLKIARYEQEHNKELQKQSNCYREALQELETYVDEHSKKSVELNLFLQERNKPKYLGLHVIDAAMKYMQELEESNKTNGDQVTRCERGITRLVMSNIRHVDENNRLHKELVKRVENERSHKLTYRKVARRYQVERNRYREASDKILCYARECQDRNVLMNPYHVENDIEEALEVKD